MQRLDVGSASNQQHVIDTRSDASPSVSSHATYINKATHLTCASLRSKDTAREAETDDCDFSLRGQNSLSFLDLEKETFGSSWEVTSTPANCHSSVDRPTLCSWIPHCPLHCIYELLPTQDVVNSSAEIPYWIIQHLETCQIHLNIK